MIITFFAKKKGNFNLNSSPQVLASNDFLRECHLFFKIEFLGITEQEFKNGKRNVPVIVLIREKGRPGFVLNETFYYHGPYASTVGYIKNERYISSSNNHFCASWTVHENRFCEIINIDYESNSINRYIPTNLPLWN